jgi:hypothetical protein
MSSGISRTFLLRKTLVFDASQPTAGQTEERVHAIFIISK